MLGRLIDGEFVKYDGKPISVYIANPTDEQLELVGYQYLDEEDEPDYDETTQYLKERYYDNGEYIIKTYDIIDIDTLEEEEL